MGTLIFVAFAVAIVDALSCKGFQDNLKRIEE